MAKIAFILLCHKDPDAIIRQAEQLTAAGDFVAIHFDARAPKKAFEQIKDGLSGNRNVTFATKRIKCGWGEWSLVKATLSAVEAAVDAFPDASHFYLLSGDCMAIKSATYAHQFLDQDDADYIESFDYFESDWIKTGFREERLIYRHWFNERAQKRLFYWNISVQRHLKLQRDIPNDLQIMIGSQWWCLRRQTMESVLGFCRKRPDIMRFFRTTWIPDETFFQTLVRHLVPSAEIRPRTLTFLMFSDYGMPVKFYNDHYDLLLSQDALFARKISPAAQDLKARLGQLYASDKNDFEISDEGRRLFKFLTERGRVGRRFAPRFWETQATLGHERELLIVVCKKWHVAKRLVWAIRQQTNLPSFEYLFHEESCALPDLGGIQTTVAKRTRHRRALIRMLYDYHQTERLLICLDSANIELMKDFADDRATTRLLEVECDFTDEYLEGHAKRAGLAVENTRPEVLSQLLPTIRNDIAFESDRIRDSNFPHLNRIRQANSPDQNAPELAAFLSVTQEIGRTLAETRDLFVD